MPPSSFPHRPDLCPPETCGKELPPARAFAGALGLSARNADLSPTPVQMPRFGYNLPSIAVPSILIRGELAGRSSVFAETHAKEIGRAFFSTAFAVCRLCSAGAGRLRKALGTLGRESQSDEDYGRAGRARSRLKRRSSKPSRAKSIEFGEGTFEFDQTLSCDVSDITIRGQGQDKTILSFAKQGQGTGGEGLSISSKEKCTIENLAVVDAKGDAIKINRCDGLTLRGVRTSWTGGPKTENGAYGLYPVLCKNVLIEDCIATDASDAGIYVGQSTNIIVRRNRAENNVAGIEIENSVNADVYENVATGNTGGILVFSLPDLELKVGRNCRVYNNEIVGNNHENFAPKGNAVANVPPGTGVMILASRQVEVFDNKIKDNQSAGMSICSYLVTQKPFEKDPGYDPYLRFDLRAQQQVRGQRHQARRPARPTGRHGDRREDPAGHHL